MVLPNTGETVTPELSLSERVQELKALVCAQKKDLLAQYNETKKLRESIQLRNLEVATDEENREPNIFVAIDDGREVVNLDQEPDRMAPVWDPKDNVFRCIRCGWEVVYDGCHGVCSSGDYSEWDVDTHDADEEKYCVMSSVREVIHPDRWHAPRGTTPPLQAYAPYLEVSPSLYQNREKEYRILLGRGATPLMCQRFRLEFTPEFGIVAWMDKILFNEFAGDAIRDGDNDRWRIYIGREVQLQDDDEDGSTFMSEMIEGAWDCTLGMWSAFWETAKDDQGVWTTKLRPEASHEDDLTQPPHGHVGVFQNDHRADPDGFLSSSEDMEGLTDEDLGYEDTIDKGSDFGSESDSDSLEDEIMFSGDEAVIKRTNA